MFNIDGLKGEPRRGDTLYWDHCGSKILVTIDDVTRCLFNADSIEIGGVCEYGKFDVSLEMAFLKEGAYWRLVTVTFAWAEIYDS